MGDTTRLTTSGRVQASDGIYVERKADADLLEVCRKGRLGVVLHSRQVGKSSLISHAASRLGQEGVLTVSIDFTAFGVHDVKVDDWYLAILDEIAGQLEVEVDADQWWDEAGNRPPVYKLGRFLEQAVLPAVPERIVVFMDEIDTTLSLPFTDDLFAAIRECYQRRDKDEAFRRLSFVLVGSSSPTELMKDERRTPFNIGTTIDLQDFSREEIQAFAPALQMPPTQAADVLDWVHDWTGGHPYLTQVLCAHVVDEDAAGWTEADLEELVHHVFLSSEAEQDFNLDNVRDMLTDRWVRQGGNPRSLLRLYLKVRLGRRVTVRSQTDVVQHLLLSGVVVAEGRHLRVRNQIYARVFSPRWVRYHMPANWRAIGIGSATAAAIVIVAIAGLKWDERRRDRRLLEFQKATVGAQEDRNTLLEDRTVIETALRTLGVGSDSPPEASPEAIEAAYESARAMLFLKHSMERIHGGDLDLEEVRAEVETAYAEHLEQLAQRLRDMADAKREEDLQAYALLHSAAARAESSPVERSVYDTVAEEYGNVTATMRGHSGSISVAAFSPDGADLVTASEDRTIRRWEVESGLQRGLVSTGSDAGFDPVFIGWQEVGAQSLVLVTSGQEPFVMLELEATDAGLERYASNFELPGVTYAARLSPDGTTLLTAGTPTTLWDFIVGEPIESTPLRSRRARRAVYDVAISRDGGRIATVQGDGTVELYGPRLGGRPRRIASDSNDSELARVQFFEDFEGEPWLLTVPIDGKEGTVQLWSMEGRQLKKVDPPTNRTINGRLCPPGPEASPGTAARLTLVGVDDRRHHVVQRLDVKIERSGSGSGSDSDSDSDSDTPERARITDISPGAELTTTDRVLAIAPSCASVATVGGDTLVKIRSLEPPPRASDLSAEVLLRKWSALFHRTVEGEKVVDVEARAPVRTSPPPSPPSERSSAKTK